MKPEHPKDRNTRIWPERKAQLEGDEVRSKCVNCGLQWLIDKSLAGFRLRCECGSWVGAPNLPQGTELKGNQGAKRLEYWFDDHSASAARFQPVFPEQVASVPQQQRSRAASSSKRIDRGILELLLLLLIFSLPAFALPQLLDLRELPWAPLFSSMLTGLLILPVCLRKAKPNLAQLSRPRWRHLAEANFVSYGAAAVIIALTPKIAAGSMLGAGLAPLLDQTGLWGGLFLVALLPALLEGFAFRGVLQGRMTQLFGSASAVLMSASAFALAHGSTLYLPAYLLLGLYLAWLRNRSQSLVPPILMHFLFNALLLMGQYFHWQLPL